VHARGIEEMRLTNDSKNLFSVGIDGSICCMQIEDKELKIKRDLQFSEEILIDKKQQEKLKNDIKSLTDQIELEKANHLALLEKQQAEN
jgi:hypothetical protein